MDKVDLQIIKMLKQNARIPLKALAEGVFLSSPATAARIERLENEGIISGYTLKIDHKKLGYPIIAFINLEMHPKDKPEFYPFINEHPNVLECNCVTGGYSMLIKVAFESTESLDTFINQIQVFGNTQTQIVFSTAKCETGVDLQKICENCFPETPSPKNKL
jgi:Lrp/AsnC family leucine-responsive transcriptional regulator